jgi:nucleotide-binding universal stress UspA family protein
MVTHILVAVGPSFSEDALSSAIIRARVCNARLTILHVIDETPRRSGAFAEGLQKAPAFANQLAQVIRGNCEKLLGQAEIKADWQTRFLPRDGRNVARVIADVAHRLNADVVVLGMRRHAWLAIGTHHVRYVLGRRTHCEVLIAGQTVRPRAAA